MKNRKNLHKIFYGKNYDNLYKGFSGFFFKKAHINLEKLSCEKIKIKNKPITNITKKINFLEIGPGRHSHYDYIKFKDNINKYFIYDQNPKFCLILKKKHRNKYFKYISNLKKIKKNSLDRIVCSHVLEHVPEPEKFILSLYRLLKKSGKISITLPCDPGFLWQIGRLFNYLTFWKFKNISKKEYFYHMAHEHINSIQNLIVLLKYNFSNFTDTFLPFRIKSINFNLMYNIVVTK
jgi:phosphatidylethanolamine/phosphatidyl-N-methylethanolamine N-methyltransferase